METVREGEKKTELDVKKERFRWIVSEVNKKTFLNSKKSAVVSTVMPSCGPRVLLHAGTTEAEGGAS